LCFSGYAGYISGVKSENLFGRTYGKITYESASQTIQRGVDMSAELKYTSEAKGNYIDQKEFKRREVQKRQDIENKQNVHQGIPISQIYKFFAYEDKYSQYKGADYDMVELQRKDLELEKKNHENQEEIKKVQSLMNFYGEEEKIFNNDGSLRLEDKNSSKMSYEEANKIAHLSSK